MIFPRITTIPVNANGGGVAVEKSSAVTENGGKEIVLVAAALDDVKDVCDAVKLVAVPVFASFIKSGVDGANCLVVTVPVGTFPAKVTVCDVKSLLTRTTDLFTPFLKQ